MRFAGLRVDGYGHLADLEVDDLPEGLTVFLGANEAGKSTLLDFIRGVLFGFPDRRHKAPFHEPLRGGRHGGSLELVDDHGAHFTLTRYVDERAPSLALVGGGMRDASALAPLLGGADDTLFRSVFAFGLGELSSFQTLDSDEIRDLVFSAGVLGAGRSATRASKAIEQRRLTLVRQRRGEAIANGLRFELDEIESALRSARHSAEGVGALLRARESAGASLAASKVDTDRLHLRRRELEQLQSAWPISRRRQSATAALGALTIPTGSERAILDSAETIERVDRQRSGRLERLRRRDELVDQRAGVLRELTVTRDALGVDASFPFDPSTVPPTAVAAEISESAQEIVVRRRALDEQRLAAEIEAHQAEVERDRIVAGRAARSDEALRSALASVKELRTHVRERERDERDVANAAARGVVHGRRSSSHPASLIAIGLLVLVALVTIGLDGSGHSLPKAIGAVIGVLAVVVGFIAWRTATRPSNAGDSIGREPSAADARRDREIARLADELDLAGDITEATLDTTTHALEEERDRRRSIDDADVAVTRVLSRVSEIESALGALAEQRRVLEHTATELAARCGIMTPVAPATITTTVAALRRGAELTAAKDRITAEVEAIEHAATEDLAGVAALGRGSGEAGSIGDDPEALLDHLVGELTRLRGVESERSDLIRAVREAESELDIALGNGRDAERIAAELARGDVLGWETERAALELELITADERYESALDALRSAERAVDEVERSDEIAALELRRSGVTASLERALREWVELGVAEALLAEALGRYERDRQPEVIALAAQLFSAVTGGRYVALVPREEIDANRRRGIDVVTPSGARLGAGDLSRGTAEQLYLCLRLAFASTFAERAVALPLVLDDVLVNFDPVRARSMAEVIAKTATTHQVLAFTCHPHIVEHFAATGHARIVDLGA